MEFLKVDTVEAAREKLYAAARDWLPQHETLPLNGICGRILAENIYAPEDIPSFRRSTVDGYAVISGDTAAAGESIPVFLTVKGSVEMGKSADISISSGECAEVPTGAMLPDGADAVVMLEYAETFGADGIALSSAVSNGENAVQIGEDARKGALLLSRGKHLLPQDIGALAAAGITSVNVYAQPRLTLISTGDELIPAHETPGPGQIRDVNTHALTALAEKNGYFAGGASVLPDDENALEQALRAAMVNSDIVAVSGGSSQGQKDMTKEIIARVAFPGVFTHGMAVKPGKPTILGYDESSKTLMAGLPGHPVSAMMVFELLFGWLIRELTGCRQAHAIPARLSCNVASAPGKLTCWPAKLEWTGGEYAATPVFGKSGLITTLTGADGYFTADRGAEGLQSGQIVLVHLF